MADQPHLQADNLSCERQDKLLFEHLNFTADSGQLIHIQGKNGSGKSSLLKIITGLLKPDSGSISWKRKNISDLEHEYNQALTYLGHKPAVKAELSVIENIQHYLALKQQNINNSQISEVLATLSLSLYQDVEAGFLSQGQQRRIALARLWLEDSQLWVLDEPYTALDVDAVELVDAAINQFLQAGNIVILTSHQHISELADISQNIRLDENAD